MAQQKRIILWSTPRSMSTVFTRSMTSRKSCKCFMEPAIDQYFFGEERVVSTYLPELGIKPNCTWKDYHVKLNSPFTGYKEVFVKEMAYRFGPFFENRAIEEYIPKDYVHSFLIRNPERTMPSIFNMYSDLGRTREQILASKDYTWKEIVDMYNWVVDTKGYKPVVVDAEDLQANPERILRLYCEGVGIEFEDAMVNWRSIPEEDMDQYTPHEKAYRLVLSTNTFLPSTPKQVIRDESISDLVKSATEEALPYYAILKEKRIR